MEEAKMGAEVIDEVLGQVIKIVLDKDGAIIITADHGNAEKMLNLKTGKTVTEHSGNPVPIWIIAKKFKGQKFTTETEQKTLPLNKEVNGILPDVAPTVLELLEIPVPADMGGTSLLGQIN